MPKALTRAFLESHRLKGGKFRYMLNTPVPPAPGMVSAADLSAILRQEDIMSPTAPIAPVAPTLAIVPPAIKYSEVKMNPAATPTHRSFLSRLFSPLVDLWCAIGAGIAALREPQPQPVPVRSNVRIVNEHEDWVDQANG